MSTFNRLDLQILGSQPAMPKNLPDQWLETLALEKIRLTLLSNQFIVKPNR